MTFNPESFNDMKDKYFLLNGRSYPDTVGGHVCVDGDTLPAARVAGRDGRRRQVAPGPMETQSTDGTNHASQPLPTVINIPANGQALLRISDLDVTEYQTLASLGIPMRVDRPQRAAAARHGRQQHGVQHELDHARGR